MGKKNGRLEKKDTKQKRHSSLSRSKESYARRARENRQIEITSSALKKKCERGREKEDAGADILFRSGERPARGEKGERKEA